MDELQKLLQNNSSAVLVNGIGGIGKTTIALAYINFEKYNSEYDHLAWVTVNNNIKDSMIDQLQTEDTDFKFETGKDNFKELMEKLRHIDGKKLLVIDNANDDADIFNTLNTLEKLEWKLLLTSRCNIKGYKSFPVDILDEKDAVTLFKKYCKEEDDKSLLELLKQIEYHTLLIELLAKAIEENPLLNIKGAYDKLKGWKLKDDLLQSEITTQHNLTTEEKQKLIKIGNYIYAVFNTEKLSEVENKYLRYFSILPSLPIKFEDLIKYFDVTDITPTDFNNILKGLQRKGWLTETGKDSYKMHPLIQAVIREKLLPNAENCKDIIISFYYLLKCDTYDNPILRKELVPFAESIWKSVYNHKNEKQISNNELALFANNLAEIFKIFAKYEKALDYQKYAILLGKKVLDSYNPYMATYYNNMGTIYFVLGKYVKALEYHNKALIIKEEVLNPNDPDLAISYNNIAVTYRCLGKFNKELEYHKKSILIREKIFGTNHPSLALSYNNIALIFMDLGNYKKALEFLKKDIEISEKVYTPDHPSFITSYNNIAESYSHLNNHEKALEFHKKAITISKKIFSQDHPDLAISYDNLANTYKSLGNYEKALEYNNKSILIIENALNKDHPELAIFYHNVASTYYNLKKYDNAKYYIDKAVEIFQLKLPKEHRSTKNSLVLQKLINDALNNQ